jgi:hypothetical protein
MPGEQVEATSLPSLWWFGLLCTGLAVLVSLGSIHKYHNSDSLIPILESVYCWKPYFWVQNRFGMLIPLLTIPVKSPLANLLCQSILNLSAGLMSLFLLAHYLLRNPAYPFPALLSIAVVLFLSPVWFPWMFFLGLSYGVWFFLGCLGLVLLECRPGTVPSWPRRGLALLCFVLAHWVYLPTALLLGPLVMARRLFCDRLSVRCQGAEFTCSYPRSAGPTRWRSLLLHDETLLALFCLMLGLAAGWIMMRLVPRPEDALRLDGVPVRHWFYAWALTVRNTSTILLSSSWPTVLLLLDGISLLLLLVPALRARSASSWRAALALGAAALSYQSLMATRKWIYDGGCAGIRYCFPGIFALQAAMTIAAVTPVCLALSPHVRRWLYGGSIATILVATVCTFGPPSLDGVRAQVDQIYQFGVDPSEVLTAHCTHIAGDYWKVWTTMFQANQRCYEHDWRPIWGITARSSPTQPYWGPIPADEVRVAVPLGDEKLAEFYLRHFKFPEMEVAERLRSITVWRPKGIARPTPSGRSVVRVR